MSFENLEKFKSDSYKKNQNLEDLLSELNHYLRIVSKNASKNSTDIFHTTYPLIFIVGVPRSGTTLLSQWLAATNEFCYPSNLISRFFEAPFFGGLIQEMLFNEKYNYKNELHIEENPISFESDVGKTKGLLEPHEFWYFWRRFFNFPDIPVETEAFESNADFNSFINDLNRFQNVFGKPAFIKSLIINPYISSFHKHIPNALFIHMKREPIANMHSLIKIRQKYYGNKDKWFSFKPKQYESLQNKNLGEQVAGQVYYINKNIEDQLQYVKDKNKLIINYDEFCKSPSTHYSLLADKLNKIGYRIDNNYDLGNSFIDYNIRKKHKNEEYQKDWNSILESATRSD